MEIYFKSLKTKQIGKSLILQICQLKNLHWKFGLKKQLKWFNKNIKPEDLPTWQKSTDPSFALKSESNADFNMLESRWHTQRAQTLKNKQPFEELANPTKQYSATVPVPGRQQTFSPNRNLRERHQQISNSEPQRGYSTSDDSLRFP